MTNRHKNVFELVLGAILLGAFLAMYTMVPAGTGSIHSALIVVACLPVTMYTLCCGPKKAGLLFLSGAGLSAILLQPLVLLSYALPALLIGLLSGAAILKLRAHNAILSISLLHLLQNCLEISLAYFLMGIRFSETYTAFIDQAISLLSDYVKAEALLLFLGDFLLCCVPAVLVIGAFCKGVLFCMVVDYLMQSKFFAKYRRHMAKGPSLRWGTVVTHAYLAVLAVQILTLIVFVGGITEYHFIFPAITAFTMACGVLYLYYYHTVNIKQSSLSQNEKLIRTGLLLLLFPVTMFAAPIHNLLKNKK